MSLRQASTVCLLHDSPDLQVLMVRRPDSARFMAGAWVFPGGAVDPEDRAAEGSVVAASSSDDPGWRAAGLRELAEEVGIWVTTEGTRVAAVTTGVYQTARDAGFALDAEAMVCFANWVTPEPLPVRFDTRFYAVTVPDDVAPLVDGREVVDGEWVTPAAALERTDRGEWLVAFPTRRTLELLAEFPSGAAFLAHVRTLGEIPVVQPRLRVAGGDVSVLLPGDSGFAEAGEDEKDPSFPERLAAAVKGPGNVAPELR